jgi:hypothetical protein
MRAQDWQNEGALFQHALGVCPESVKVCLVNLLSQAWLPSELGCLPLSSFALLPACIHEVCLQILQNVGILYRRTNEYDEAMVPTSPRSMPASS